MSAWVVVSITLRLWYSEIVASYCQVAHQHRFSQWAGDRERRAQFIELLASMTSDTSIYPLRIVTRDAILHSRKFFRHFNALIEGSRERFGVNTISRTHHLTSGTFYNYTVTTVTHHLIGAQFFRTCRLYTAIHPMEFQIFFTFSLKP